jgi:hypothetical protein
MSRVLGSIIGRFIILSGLVFLTAGCNNSNVVGPDKGAGAFSAGLGADGGAAAFSFASAGEGSGDGLLALDTPTGPTDGDDTGGTGEAIAKIHNPEPASMALMGLGLLGLLRRRKK